MKLKTVYVCQKCQFQSTKWAGKCPNCSEWNSFVEDVINVGKSAKALSRGLDRPKSVQKPQAIHSIQKNKSRSQTGTSEFDQVLGGGFVEGSLVLLSGEPGIGKSTLTLQVVNEMAKQKESVLYITGEESIHQVSQRAQRLACTSENIQLLYETNLENILASIEAQKPEFLVLDSIQVISSNEIAGPAGALSQVRYVTEMVMSSIKTLGIPTVLIGHVNKDGKIAGPKVLEHLVDTVLLLEGERDHSLRMLRAVKNRFGNISEVGLFEMDSEGMQEIKNPGERILQSRPKNAIGSCLTMSMEGNRPLLIEVQALVNKCHFAYPKRTASGFDRNRLELLIAVLQKHSKLNLAEHDVYLNIIGGLQLRDPAADLAVCMAIASSLKQKALPEDLVAFGEVGLTGEIRPSQRQSERKKASKKMGLKISQLKSIKDIV